VRVTRDIEEFEVADISKFDEEKVSDDSEFVFHHLKICYGS
jgi:hypothetical protein